MLSEMCVCVSVKMQSVSGPEGLASVESFPLEDVALGQGSHNHLSPVNSQKEAISSSHDFF